MSAPEIIIDENGQPVFCEECRSVLMVGHEADRNYHFAGCKRWRLMARVREAAP